ncbi:telomere-associated protein RIF1 [Euwallacea fornicatus]|uniref:telomere-associated protein RIF1 n=1 Tax=Euwallacea fornicatus TaxID=995702 RepID=UPI00338FC9DA
MDEQVRKSGTYSKLEECLGNNTEILKNPYQEQMTEFKQVFQSSNKGDQMKALQILELLLDKNVHSISEHILIILEQEELIKKIECGVLSRIIEKCMQKFLNQKNHRCLASLFKMCQKYCEKYGTQFIPILKEVISRTEYNQYCGEMLFDVLLPLIFNKEIFVSMNKHLSKPGYIDMLMEISSVMSSSELNDDNCKTFVEKAHDYVLIISDLRTNNFPDWDKLWIILIRLLGLKLHRSMTLINKFLRIAEHAFRNPSSDERIKGYICWKELIANISLDANYISSEKQLKLLLAPLKAKFSRKEGVIYKKFEIYIFLMEKLQSKSVLVLKDFLEFCFGNIEENTDPNRFGLGKTVPELRLRSAKVLLAVLGHYHLENHDCLDTESEIKLNSPVLNNNNIADVWQQVIYSVAECCLLLKEVDFRQTKDLIFRCFWRSLLRLILEDGVINTEQCFTLIGKIMDKFHKDTISAIIFEETVNSNKPKSLDLIVDQIENFLNVIFLVPLNKQCYLQVEKFVTTLGNLKSPSVKSKVQSQIFSSFVNFKTIESNVDFIADIWILVANEGEDYARAGSLNFLLWPVFHIHQLSEKTKEVLIYEHYKCQLVPFIEKSNSIHLALFRSFDKILKNNSLLLRNILDLVCMFPPIIENKDITNATLEILTTMLIILYSKQKSENLEVSQIDLIDTYFCKILDSDISRIQDQIIIKNLCNCIEQLLKLRRFSSLSPLEQFLKCASDLVKATFAKFLVLRFLIDIFQEENDLHVTEKLQRIITILKSVKPSEAKKNVSTVISLGGRSAKIAHLMKQMPSSPKKPEQSPFKLFGKDIETHSPLNMVGSQIKNQKSTPKRSVTPKVTPSKPSIDDESTSNFVVINSEVKLDKEKLTEHQRETLKKRREDIPALYQDLSQSVSQSFDSNYIDGETKINTSNERKGEDVEDKIAKKVQLELQKLSMNIVGAEEFISTGSKRKRHLRKDSESGKTEFDQGKKKLKTRKSVGKKTKLEKRAVGVPQESKKVLATEQQLKKSKSKGTIPEKPSSSINKENVSKKNPLESMSHPPEQQSSIDLAVKSETKKNFVSAKNNSKSKKRGKRVKQLIQEKPISLRKNLPIRKTLTPASLVVDSKSNPQLTASNCSQADVFSKPTQDAETTSNLLENVMKDKKLHEARKSIAGLKCRKSNEDSICSTQSDLFNETSCNGAIAERTNVLEEKTVNKLKKFEHELKLKKSNDASITSSELDMLNETLMGKVETTILSEDKKVNKGRKSTGGLKLKKSNEASVASSQSNLFNETLLDTAETTNLLENTTVYKGRHSGSGLKPKKSLDEVKDSSKRKRKRVSSSEEDDIIESSQETNNSNVSASMLKWSMGRRLSINEKCNSLDVQQPGEVADKNAANLALDVKLTNERKPKDTSFSNQSLSVHEKIVNSFNKKSKKSSEGLEKTPTKQRSPGEISENLNKNDVATLDSFVTSCSADLKSKRRRLKWSSSEGARRRSPRSHDKEESSKHDNTMEIHQSDAFNGIPQISPQIISEYTSNQQAEKQISTNTNVTFSTEIENKRTQSQDTQTQGSESLGIDSNVEPNLDLPQTKVLTESEQEFASMDTASLSLGDLNNSKGFEQLSSTIEEKECTITADVCETEDLFSEAGKEKEEGGEVENNVYASTEEKMCDITVVEKLDEETSKVIEGSPLKWLQSDVIQDAANILSRAPSDLPTSPVTGDTPNRTSELLNNTSGISPINSSKSSPEREDNNKTVRKFVPLALKFDNEEEDLDGKKQKSPEKADDAPEKISDKVSLEPEEKSGDGLVEVSLKHSEKNMKDLRLYIEKNNHFSWTKHGSPAVHRLLSKRRSGQTLSPSASRIKKLMSNVKPSSQSECIYEIDKEDLLTFTRDIPSPLAVPKSSILKRKHPDSLEDGMSPCPKRKRVNFSDPCTTSKKLFIKEEIAPPSLFNLISNEDIDNQFLEVLASNHIIEKPQDMSETQLESRDDIPICPELLNCDESVSIIARKLTSPRFVNALLGELNRSSSKSIENLPEQSEASVSKQPCKMPDVATVYQALDSYYNKNFKTKSPLESCKMNREEKVREPEKSPLALAQIMLQNMDVKLELSKIVERAYSENISLDTLCSAILGSANKKDVLIWVKSHFHLQIPDLLEEDEFPAAIRKISNTLGIRKLFEILRESYEEEAETFINSRIEKKSLQSLVDSRTLEELNTAVWSCVENGKCSRNELLQTIFLPNINPVDLNSYFNSLNVVELSDIVTMRLQGEDRPKFIKRIVNGSSHVEETKTNALAAYSIEELARNIMERGSTKEIVAACSFMFLTSNKNNEDLKEISRLLIDWLTSTLPPSQLMDLSIQFLKKIPIKD